jgi:hypothetical protein
MQIDASPNPSKHVKTKKRERQNTKVEEKQKKKNPVRKSSAGRDDRGGDDPKLEHNVCLTENSEFFLFSIYPPRRQKNLLKQSTVFFRGLGRRRSLF